MKKIALTQGQYALVDDEDYEELMQYKWQAKKARIGDYYAGRCGKKRGSIVYMHRHVLGFPDCSEIDHKDRNKLNNQKSNLLESSQYGNSQNRGKYACNKSGFVGVRKSPSGRYVSMIARGGCGNNWLGLFDTAELASAMYFHVKQQLDDIEKT